ncbi:hypothetical protein D3C73_1328390 [compost metagenome]
MDDRGDALVLKALLLLFDKVGVFYAAGGIVEHFNAVSFRQFAHRTHVSHRDWLPAREVNRHRQADIRNILCAFFIN